jgi:hypothetical protein
VTAPCEKRSQLETKNDELRTRFAKQEERIETEQERPREQRDA